LRSKYYKIRNTDIINPLYDNVAEESTEEQVL